MIMPTQSHVILRKRSDRRIPRRCVERFFASLRMTAVLAAMLQGPLSAQVSGQSFEVTPEVGRVTVGDSVTLRFRVRLDERDLLFDTVPQPLAALPPGIRILTIEKLTRTPDRLFHGRARIAFYRTGRLAVPVFGLPFMRAVKGVQRATLASDSAFVEVVPLLPAGNPPLKDIREIGMNRGRDFRPLLVAGALGLAALVLYFRRRRRRVPTPAAIASEPAVPRPPPSAYSLALEKLNRVEREHWPLQGQVARHYESVVDVLRDYLEAAEGVPARERTTAELLWALPPHLSEAGLRESFRELLNQADLVKFARLQPDQRTAERFLGQCRALLQQWHGAASSSPVVDALR
jgi:hypothetical protein